MPIHMCDIYIYICVCVNVYRYVGMYVMQCNAMQYYAMVWYGMYVCMYLYV